MMDTHIPWTHTNDGHKNTNHEHTQLMDTHTITEALGLGTGKSWTPHPHKLTESLARFLISTPLPL